MIAQQRSASAGPTTRRPVDRRELSRAITSVAELESLVRYAVVGEQHDLPEAQP